MHHCLWTHVYKSDLIIKLSNRTNFLIPDFSAGCEDFEKMSFLDGNSANFETPVIKVEEMDTRCSNHL